MKKLIQFHLPFCALLIAAPLAGVWLAGHDPRPYLAFPPQTRAVAHAPFSWPVFIGLAAVICATILPFLIRIRSARGVTAAGDPPVGRFPWWGWTALASGALCWTLAWTRFEWMKPLQRHTFLPLWLAYIVVVNALTHRRTGRCLLTHQSRWLALLFPLSAAFWWFYEFLNRFVQNWYYVGGEAYSAWEYFTLASLSFTTVLPATLSTEQWLASFPRATAGLDQFVPARITRPKRVAKATLVGSCAGLVLMSAYPDQLFPLVWLAPVTLLIAFRALAGGPSFFPELRRGDWRRVYRLALAALICGFFWEMWNGHSLAKWIYAIPYVHRFQLFEMPILGYAGYLPFGITCAIVADLIRREGQP